MSKSKIEWTDRVWNPVTGCDKVSQGCKNCYAEVIANRFPRVGIIPGSDIEYSTADAAKNDKFTVLLHPGRLEQPLHWRKPSMVFVNSMSDLFHESVPFEFIKMVYGIMHHCKKHTFQILTKRPERAVEFYNWYKTTIGFPEALNNEYNHVWIGTSVENQKTADERIPQLLQIPAAVRFLSCEPLLGEIDLQKHNIFNEKGDSELHWVICGGESGHGARPMHPDWARKLRDDCKSAGVPFFFKQWGEWRPFQETVQPPFYRDCNTNKDYDAHGMDFIDAESGKPGKFMGYKWIEDMDAIDMNESYDMLCMFLKMGKMVAGRLLDGVEHNEYPVG